MDNRGISQAVIRRLPRYYRYLGELLENGVERISSNDLSKRMKVTASQIRQDLNNFGGFGQQGYGYNVKYLYTEIGKILGLEEYLKRKPKELSGGQRQRVALGRAMVRQPAVFLLDEPLSNLDAKLRTEMRSQIAALHKRLQTTFVYLTHDQTEAMTMGDRIVVMKDGVIQQFDTPQMLYNYPCNKFVAGFIGSPQMNFLNVVVKKEGENLFLTFGTYKIPVQKPELEAYVDKEVIMGIRPEDIHAEESFLSISEASNIEANVDLAEMMGSEIYLYLNCCGQKMVARVPSRTGIRADDMVKLALDVNKIHVFDAETENVICH